MSMATANAEIRKAMVEAEARRHNNDREAALWRLEHALEDLLASGYRFIPFGSFDINEYIDACQLTDQEKRGLGCRGLIKPMLNYVLDELLEQPLPQWDERIVEPFSYNTHDLIDW